MLPVSAAFRSGLQSLLASLETSSVNLGQSDPSTGGNTGKLVGSQATDHAFGLQARFTSPGPQIMQSSREASESAPSTHAAVEVHAAPREIALTASSIHNSASLPRGGQAEEAKRISAGSGAKPMEIGSSKQRRVTVQAESTVSSGISTAQISVPVETDARAGSARISAALPKDGESSEFAGAESGAGRAGGTHLPSQESELRDASARPDAPATDGERPPDSGVDIGSAARSTIRPATESEKPSQNAGAKGARLLSPVPGLTKTETTLRTQNSMAGSAPGGGLDTPMPPASGGDRQEMQLNRIPATKELAHPSASLRRTSAGGPETGRGTSASSVPLGTAPHGLATPDLVRGAAQMSETGNAAPVAASASGAKPADSSTHDAFDALDSDAGLAQPSWTHADARHAEAGFQDPALGWVGVRADLGGGAIHASLVPSTADAAQTLGGHLAGLNLHLAEQQTRVDTLTLAAPEDGSRNAAMDPSANQRGNQQAGSDSQQGRSPVKSTEESRTIVIKPQPSLPGLETSFAAANGMGTHVSLVA
jgi:hypothetical protein